jgi:predicted Rossmann-fold nucleotide-binding protein
VLTWAQLGLHRKPCALLNVAGYFDPLLSFLEHSVDQRFVRRENAGLVLVATSIQGLFEQLARWEAPPSVEKWIDRAST